MRLLISRIKESRLLTEAYVLQQRWSQPRGRPCVVVFPGEVHSGSGGDLRGRAIARELRRLGWRAIVAPPQFDWKARERLLAAERPDVILLQQSRHPLNRPGRYSGIPCVFDADDADFQQDPEPVIECCRASRAAIAGSRHLAEFFRRHNPDVTVVWTGTYLKPRTGMTPNARRRPVIAWAQSDFWGYPEEAAFVHEIVLRLAKEAGFEFHLYGVRDQAAAEEYLKPVRAAGVNARSIGPMRYRRFTESLEEAAIGLQPIRSEFSRGKSFGKLLAYMVSGVATVTANELDYPLFFRHGENGMLATGVDEWVESCRLLLDDPKWRGQIASRAAEDFRSRLTSRRAAELVSEVLHRAIGGAPGRWI